MEEQQASKQLQQALWNSADVLRSKMDANEYKSYLLGLVFYKYLSDTLLWKTVDLLEEHADNLVAAQRIYEAAFADDENREVLIEALQADVSYVIQPQLTFTHLVEAVRQGRFQRSDLQQAFRDIEQSSKLFVNLFADVDLDSKKLGATPQKQNDTISKVMQEIDTLDISHAGDVLGDAYEYLISQFASDSGKKAGEFYTPQSVSTLMTRIVLHGREDKKGFSLYDPTMGSGSLLLNAKKYSKEKASLLYFGQEQNTSTYNLARMNMILHGVANSNQFLSNADTLDEDWPVDEPTIFDGVMMNPPYSAKWSAAKVFLEDPRFSPYGVLAPKSKADFAFLLHGYYHLKNDGVMAIVLPHGVLFRGNAEGKIRQRLLDMGAIDTVIGLPPNIFFNTSIPTTVILLKKNRTARDVFFIDASKEFTKAKTQNLLEPKHIDKILQTYIDRKDIDKYAHLATYEEIKENEYNLNIPRYVDTFEEEEPIDLLALSQEVSTLNADIRQTESDLLALFDQLQVTEDTKAIIEAAKAVLR